MDWSIHEVATFTGTTSRTLRHYDAIGLLPPTRVGGNGYRRYDESALVRLQRILLLRELGLALPQIAEVLDRETSELRALSAHLDLLRQEKSRLDRQIAAVSSTIDALKGGEKPMAEKMFDGFDHTQHRDEVTERWGADAYARGDSWWRGMTDSERAAWQQQVADLNAGWRDAASRGIATDSAEAQALAERHVQWLRGIPSTPAAASGGDVKAYVLGLGDMYVADPRFAANYGGADGATFVRDALGVYAQARL
ncbi:MerR family transcriptional regulator [Microbacterium protaetiae]|uniref:MerR family transcriptional regulator n=1 Tax=Microbacterium protaetiae TaxID=2509458 RepID=A0A4P6EFF9_9MICO|nr:MerR family transcriptional regulator [Microbacterium protaetiae]QAY59869.1 MerR family transcriptional regulator [Microbacterium protaetiae]